MKKVYILLLALILCASTAVQAQTKLGHINVQEMLELMPERSAAEKQLATLNNQLEERLKVLTNEYTNKITAFQALDESTPASTAGDMRDEIISMEQRIQKFRADAEQDLVKKQEELLQPMLEKLQKAIDDVSSENQFTYVFDISSGSVVYQSGEDLTPLVKSKLGIGG